MDWITDILGMGGYAEFVWPAFAVTIVVMVALLIVSQRALRADRITLESLESVRKPRRRGAREPDEGGADDET